MFLKLTVFYVICILTECWIFHLISIGYLIAISNPKLKYLLEYSFLWPEKYVRGSLDSDGAGPCA